MRSTILFCTSFIASHQKDRSLGRYEKWLDYYMPRMTQFGASHIALIDDGTPMQRLQRLGLPIVDADKRLPHTPPGIAMIFRFQKHLGRSSVANYPGWWRSFSYSARLSQVYRFKKIVHIESDAYVISQRLARRIRSIQRGWNVLWCPRYRFPECSIQVVAGASVSDLASFWERGMPFWTTRRRDIQADMAEKMLPFTKVIKEFRGDRYGEYRRTVPRSVDFVCQANTPMRFERFLAT